MSSIIKLNRNKSSNSLIQKLFAKKFVELSLFNQNKDISNSKISNLNQSNFEKYEANKSIQKNKSHNKYKINFKNKDSKHKNNKITLSDNENTSASTKDSSLNSLIKNTTINSYNNININFEYSRKNYCNYIPKKEEMSEKADKKPCHFPIECYHGINKVHNEIGKKDYLNLEIDKINNCNDSYKAIDKKDHILLNHLCQKTISKKIINSFTIKYRHKNTTFVYFK